MTTDRTWTLPRTPPDRGTRAGSFGVSAVVHVLVVVVLLAVKAPSELRPGPAGWSFAARAGDSGGGGGGGSETVHLLQLTRPPAEPPNPSLPALPSVVTPRPLLPELVPDPTHPLPLPSGAGDLIGSLPAPGAGRGAGTGAGSGTGTGSGSGAGAGEGAGAGAGGDGVRPPAPLMILVPPAATPSVRGKAATVRLQVDSSGTVRDADVVVSSGDRSYDERLRRIALGWRFRPARDAANRPISYPFEVSLKF